MQLGLNILGSSDNLSPVFTFSSKINIDTTAIGNKIVNIFKQGSDDLNGVIDIHFEFNRTSDSTGALDKLVINIFYEAPNDSQIVNLQSFEVYDISKLIDKYVQFTVCIDSVNSLVNVYADDEIISTFTLNLSEILEMPFQTPKNLNNNLNLFIGGAKELKIKNVFIWNRIVSQLELEFLNKLMIN